MPNSLDGIMRAIEELRTHAQRAYRRSSSTGSNPDAAGDGAAAEVAGATGAAVGVAAIASDVDGVGDSGAERILTLGRSCCGAQRDEAGQAAGGSAELAALHATFEAMDVRFATLERLLGAAVGASSVPATYKQKSRPKRKQVVRQGTNSMSPTPGLPSSNALTLLRGPSPSADGPSPGSAGMCACEA